jgi:hypothetical protein
MTITSSAAKRGKPREMVNANSVPQARRAFLPYGRRCKTGFIQSFLWVYLGNRQSNYLDTLLSFVIEASRKVAYRDDILCLSPSFSGSDGTDQTTGRIGSPTIRFFQSCRFL